MKKNVLLFIPTCALLLTLGSSAKASFISIDIRSQVTVDKDSLKASIAVTNNGDEPAYNIQINTEMDGRDLKTPVQETLKVRETYSTELSSRLGLEKAGRYPFIVHVEYTDANQYPFSALHVSHFNYKESAPSKVFGKIDNVSFSSKGRLHLHIKNLDDQEKKVNLRLILPRELSSAGSSKGITLKPNAEEKVDFAIKNFSALQDSTYPVFAVMEYEQGDLHFSTSAVGNVQIIKEELLKSKREILIGLGVVLLVILIYINMKARRARKT